MTTNGTAGSAGIPRRGRFGWEHAGEGADLEAALDQLEQHALALDDPPRRVGVTNRTNAGSVRHALAPVDRLEPKRRDGLRDVWLDPVKLRPGLARQPVTEAAAARFAHVGQELRAQGDTAQAVVHVLCRLVVATVAGRAPAAGQAAHERPEEGSPQARPRARRASALRRRYPQAKRDGWTASRSRRSQPVSPCGVRAGGVDLTAGGGGCMRTRASRSSATPRAGRSTGRAGWRARGRRRAPTPTTGRTPPCGEPG